MSISGSLGLHTTEYPIKSINNKPQSGLLQGWSCNSGLALRSVSHGHKMVVVARAAHSHVMASQSRKREEGQKLLHAPLNTGRGVNFPKASYLTVQNCVTCPRTSPCRRWMDYSYYDRLPSIMAHPLKHGGWFCLLRTLCCCNLNQTEVLSRICWVDADDIQHDGLGELNLMKSVS